MADGTKACPACAETIQAAANKCRFCGTDIEAYTASREQTVERTLFSGHPRVIYIFHQYVMCVITLGIALFFYWIRSLSTTFVITTQRVRVEQGLFSKVQRNLELFRVDHFDVVKPIGMQALGLCEVLLHSSDEGMPSVLLYGIPGLEQLADELRECSLRERTRRRVMPIERM
ncbi:PH domain-containing protein [Dyella sp. 2HG41-7]|uniref:PH domain-containing protein n=1 Tax=Dyella sp. 2HG41-7 TaxID=2883239 RepID=UPI001F22F42C|nr:PH domain-containing protein [Dyella sp. 2HG41-7]